MQQGGSQSSRASQTADASMHDRSKQVLAALTALGSILAIETNPIVAGSHVVRTILDVLGATRAVILVKDLKVIADGRRSHDGQSTVCRSEALSVRGLPRDLLRQVLESGASASWGVESPNRVAFEEDQAEVCRSRMVCLPLLVHGRPVGLLYVELNLHSQFDMPDACNFLTLIASQSALVFGALAAAETLARRDEELAGMHVDAELGRRLSDLSAKLADPLTSIMLDVYAADRWFRRDAGHSSAGRNALSHVREEVRRIVHIVGQIREIAGSDRGEPKYGSQVSPSDV